MPKFIIPGRLPGLNDMIDAARRNRYASAEQKKEYTELVAWCAKAARLPRMEQINVTVFWYEPDKRRDKDNIMAGTKFIFDGLVVAGVLPNDGWGQIGDIQHIFDVDPDDPRVEIEINEARRHSHEVTQIQSRSNPVQAARSTPSGCSGGLR